MYVRCSRTQITAKTVGFESHVTFDRIHVSAGRALLTFGHCYITAVIFYL